MACTRILYGGKLHVKTINQTTEPHGNRQPSDQSIFPFPSIDLRGPEIAKTARFEICFVKTWFIYIFWHRFEFLANRLCMYFVQKVAVRHNVTDIKTTVHDGLCSVSCWLVIGFLHNDLQGTLENLTCISHKRNYVEYPHNI